MQTAKQRPQEVLRHLPGDCTLEDIHYHLYVLQKIGKGQNDIAEGRCCTTQEAQERLGKWLET